MPQFLCFDLELRRPEDADLVEATTPAHACQEFVAFTFRTSGEEPRPFNIAVRFSDGNPNVWDAYTVVPEVSINYNVKHLSPAEFAAVPKATMPKYHPPAPSLRSLPGANGDSDILPFKPTRPDDPFGYMPGDPSLYV